MFERKNHHDKFGVLHFYHHINKNRKTQTQKSTHTNFNTQRWHFLICLLEDTWNCVNNTCRDGMSQRTLVTTLYVSMFLIIYNTVYRVQLFKKITQISHRMWVNVNKVYRLQKIVFDDVCLCLCFVLGQLLREAFGLTSERLAGG